MLSASHPLLHCIDSYAPRRLCLLLRRLMLRATLSRCSLLRRGSALCFACYTDCCANCYTDCCANCTADCCAYCWTECCAVAPFAAAAFAVAVLSAALPLLVVSNAVLTAAAEFAVVVALSLHSLLLATSITVPLQLLCRRLLSPLPRFLLCFRLQTDQ